MIEAEIRQIGNSKGIIFPQEMLNRMKVDKGDKVFITESPGGYSISVYDEKIAQQMEVAEGVMREDRSLLKALSKK